MSVSGVTQFMGEVNFAEQELFAQLGPASAASSRSSSVSKAPIYYVCPSLGPTSTVDVSVPIHQQPVPANITIAIQKSGTTRRD